MSCAREDRCGDRTGVRAASADGHPTMVTSFPPRPEGNMSTRSFVILAALAPSLLIATAWPAGAHQTSGESRPAVVRDATWNLDDDLAGGPAVHAFRYGKATDVPLFGDWNGDRRVTPGVWRPEEAKFYLRNDFSSGPADIGHRYGRTGDVPVAGDFDGDGLTDVGIVRGRYWHLDTNRDGEADLVFPYGLADDGSFVGDWDGDGRATPGIRRDGVWHLRNSNTSGPAEIQFRYGRPNDRPVVGRWSQDDVDRPGVVRDATWHVKHELSAGPADHSFRYGRAGDVPLAWRSDAPRLTYTFTVGTEGNPNGDIDRFARLARTALNDDRGWALDGDIDYVQVGSGGDFHLWLTDDDDVGEKAPTCSDDWSCTVGDDLYINDDNWNSATTTWEHRDLTAYRRYVINHEAGHWLGVDHYNDSDRCRDVDGDGDAEAPVMMQQSIDLHGCATNVWPLPFERNLVRGSHLD